MIRVLKLQNLPAGGASPSEDSQTPPSHEFDGKQSPNILNNMFLLNVRRKYALNHMI